MGYSGAGTELLTRAKYANRRGCLSWLADELAAQLWASQAGGSIELVTWVPSTPSGVRGRGFDLGKLLGRQVARRLGRPCRRLFTRVDDHHQTAQSRDVRSSGPRLQLARVALTTNIKSVCLVDDVCTTGSSLATAANLLRSVGIESIHGAVAARTPLRNDGVSSIIRAGCA